MSVTVILGADQPSSSQDGTDEHDLTPRVELRDEEGRFCMRPLVRPAAGDDSADRTAADR